MRAFEARQVVEPVGVLQVLELASEDEVEGRAEQPPEQVMLLGEAADPEVDVIEAGDVALLQYGILPSASWRALELAASFVGSVMWAYWPSACRKS